MQYKKQETKEKILSCALDEFYTFGESNASIRRIADKAGVAVGNIYNYFESKQAIFKEIISPVKDSFESFFSDAVNVGINLRDIDNLTNMTVPFMVEYKREIRLLMNSQNEQGGKQKEQIFDRCAERIKAEIDKIRRHYDKQPISFEYSRALSKSFLHGAFELLFSSEDTRAVSAMLRDYFGFFWKGLDKRL